MAQVSYWMEEEGAFFGNIKGGEPDRTKNVEHWTNFAEIWQGGITTEEAKVLYKIYSRVTFCARELSSCCTLGRVPVH